MSRYNDMSREDRQREERREYDNDVFYDVWRSGRDTDRISDDRVADHYWNGDQASEAAAHEIRLQRQSEERRMEERQMEEELMRQQQEEYEQAQQTDIPSNTVDQQIGAPTKIT